VKALCSEIGLDIGPATEVYCIPFAQHLPTARNHATQRGFEKTCEYLKGKNLLLQQPAPQRLLHEWLLYDSMVDKGMTLPLGHIF